MYGNEEIDQQELTYVLKNCQVEIEALLNQRNYSERGNDNLVIEIAEVIETLKKFKPIYKESKIDNKAKLIKQICNKIIYDNGTLIMKYTMPFSILLKPEIELIKNVIEFRSLEEMLPEKGLPITLQAIKI